MVYFRTVLEVSDNTGGSLARCIKVCKKSSKGLANVGDIVILTLIRIRPNKMVKSGQLCKGVVVTSCKQYCRYGGIYIKCSRNLVILLNDRMLPMGTRILNAVCSELRFRNYTRLVSMAPFIV